MKKVFSIKSLLFLLVAFVSIQAAMAQGGDPVDRLDPKAKQKIRAAQIAFITDRLGLTPSEAEKFWPVYNEFDQKRNKIREEMRDARRNKPDNKSDEEYQKELIDLGLKMKQRELDLEKEYSDKIMNVITPQKLMALRQAEVDFRTMVIRQIQQRQMQQRRRQDLRDKNEPRLQRRNN